MTLPRACAVGMQTRACVFRPAQTQARLEGSEQRSLADTCVCTYACVRVYMQEEDDAALRQEKLKSSEHLFSKVLREGGHLAQVSSRFKEK